MAATTLAQLRTNEADAGTLMANLLAQPRSGSFDPDAWHVMQERDNALIRDEILHGIASDAFVYSFDISGKKVTGVSVVGARELASQYKGIKSRIVATIEKRGGLFIFRTFTPLSIETRHLPELEMDDDYYECVLEVSDIKSGNSIEVRKKESRTETKRDKSTYERPHYDVIAESKAYRNGVLSILPQSVIRDFKTRCLAAGKSSNEATIQQRRAAASTYAAKNGLALDRQALAELGFAELDGLGAAAQTGIDAFRKSAIALGLVQGAINQDTGEIPPPPPPAAARTPAPRAATPTPAPKPPAFDLAGFIGRINACTDLEMLQAMSDESESIPEGPDRDAVNAALTKRDAELAPPPEDHQQAQQEPAASRRRGASRVSAE